MGPVLRTRWRGVFSAIAIFCLGCACGPRRQSCPPSDGRSARCGACPAWSSVTAAACACAEGTVPWLGACVSSQLAARACGDAERLTAGVCVRRTCEDGSVFDDGAGTCIALSAVRAGDTGGGLPLDPDERVSCPPSADLRVTRARARCQPRLACARGLLPRLADELDAGAATDARAPDPRADGGAPEPCAPAIACPPGSLAEPAAPHACASFMTVRGFVDAARWLRLTAGADGAGGSRWVCEPLDGLGAKALDARGLSRAITLQLDIPGNDVTQATLTLRPDEGVEGTPGLERGLEPYADAFRSLGGSSTTTQAAVRVVCSIPAAPRPARIRTDSASVGRDGG